MFDQFGHRKSFLIFQLYRGKMDKHNTNTHSCHEEQKERVQIAVPGVRALWYVGPDEVEHTNQDTTEDDQDNHR